MPVIVRWPKGGVPAGKTSTALNSQIDWMASMAALLGERMPAGAAPDSYNRLPVVLGQSDEPRPWVLEQASNKTLSLRTPHWKYIQPNGGPAMVPWGPKIETGYLDRPQLYSDSDTGELHNVAPEHPEKVKRMDEIIQAVRKNDKAALDSLHASPALAPCKNCKAK